MKRVMIRIVSAVLAAEAFAALPKMPVRPTPDAATLKMNAGRELKFMNPLPRQRCGGKTCGTYNNREFACPGLLTTQEHDLGDTIWNLRKVVGGPHWWRSMDAISCANSIGFAITSTR